MGGFRNRHQKNYKMKPIKFKQNAAQKIYTDYLKRIRQTTKTLPAKDSDEILMEWNSHIYEGTKDTTTENEVENLLVILDKLGSPEEVLKPLIATKKIQQATKTFNPIHLIQALALNITNGVSYLIFSFLYFFLFSGVFLIFAKIFNPNVGLYYKGNEFKVLGLIKNIENKELTEVLGNWFIPLILLSIVVLYVVITLLLKLKLFIKNK